MKTIFTVLLCLCSLAKLFAQYNSNQNKIWAFGYHGGLDFTSGVPVSFSSSINTIEGCASVCNSVGNLLFYTNGENVYNRLGLIMPGGGAIVPYSTISASQAAVIVPFINDTNKYYIFSQEEYPSGGNVAYSIVDMTLDGGLGDVVTGSTGTVITTGMTEKMIAIPGNSCNIWLIVHKADLPQFYAYEITSSGISSTPVISYTGTLTGLTSYEFGVMKCSHDRQKIVAVSGYTDYRGVELFDFDPSTGIVSNCRVLEPTQPVNSYGAEFSPDNTKLYTSSDTAINQWDISLPTTAAIIGSKITVDTLGSGLQTDLKLAPDGKIYYQSGYTVNRINLPNLPGAGCSVTASVVSLSPGFIRVGLPSLVWHVSKGTITGKTSLCEGFSTMFTGSTSGGTWSSSAPNATVSSSGLVTGITAGTAIISYFVPGSCPSTAIVTVNPIPAPIAGPTTVAAGSSITLTNATGGGSWSSSDSTKAMPNTTGVITGVAPGTATIYYLLPTGCKQTVVINVTSKNTTVIGSIQIVRPMLYPNPATNEITVIAEPPTFTSFTIYNPVGQVIETNEITDSETRVNVKAYPPGEYLVTFTGNTSREMIRFTKW